MHVQEIRNDFPILQEQVYGYPLVYLDNAATTQKPRAVLDALYEQYAKWNGNVHRGSHYLSNRSTERFETARETIRSFLGAQKTDEIIFTKGDTEAINLVACCYGEAIGAGDEIIISEAEHHSNLVPWQQLCQQKKATLRVIPFDENGVLNMDAYRSQLCEKTKLVAICHISNVLGVINPVQEMIALAHEKGAPVLIDGAQAVAHMPVDVTQLDCDFYTFSGHKIYGPNGIGVLYVKQKRLDQMHPYQFGGEMVDRVSFAQTTFEKAPFKFEAGTPDYPAAIALAEAIRYIQQIGWDNLHEYEKNLSAYAHAALSDIQGIQFYGCGESGVISFNMDGIHCYDLALMLDKLGITLRAGSHCAQPVMAHYRIQGCARVSLCFYNTAEEIDALCSGIRRIQHMFETKVK